MNWLASLILCLLVQSPAWGADRGKAVFHQLCTSCHGPAGYGNRLVEAPSIAGLPAWYVSAQLEKFRSGLRGKHPDDDAGNRMRPLAMTLEAEDVAVVSAYVASLPAVKAEPVLTGGKAARGKASFATCVACHGANAGGNEALHAPPLNMANDWYLYRQLSNFRAHVRAYDPADTFGMTMAPQASLLPNEKAVKDVVAYIASIDPSAAAAAAGTSLTVADLPKYAKGSAELAAKGKDLFATNCAVCHGASGNGDGSGGASLTPKPRNFHSDGASWTHGNSAWSIYYTLANGSPGTGMAAYKSLSPEDRWALVHYVISLAPGAARSGKMDAQGEKTAKDEIASASAAPKDTLPIDFAMKLLVKESEAKGNRN